MTRSLLSRNFQHAGNIIKEGRTDWSGRMQSGEKGQRPSVTVGSFAEQEGLAPAGHIGCTQAAGGWASACGR